jgi:AraC-like DNA-binding protein
LQNSIDGQKFMRKSLINADTRVFPANYLLLLINFLENQGYEIAEVLRNIETPEQLTADPEQFVSHAYLKQFLATVLDTTQVPELGLYFGQQLNFTAHGDMGYAIITSKNLAEAIQMVLKYFKTRTALAEVNIATVNKHRAIKAKFNLLPDNIEQFLIDALFASIVTVGKFLLSSRHHAPHVYFTKPTPSNLQPYYDLFGANVFFSASDNEYHIPEQGLDLTFPLSNPVAREIAERKCRNKMQELEHLDDLVSKVKTLMVTTPGYFPSIDELAQKLHMSTRTLRRKLNALDYSYQQIFDDLRKELAINYLQNSALSIVDIAHMLQFSDSSNFSSAFRKWTHKSPSAFR